MKARIDMKYMHMERSGEREIVWLCDGRTFAIEVKSKEYRNALANKFCLGTNIFVNGFYGLDVLEDREMELRRIMGRKRK